MLHQLEIESYAVVEKLSVEFHPGLNLLTGETGSGKSILVDAFSLLLGARASPELIRAGAERARVAGVFELDGLERAAPAGVGLEQGELLVEREILANGKSRVHLNGRLTTVAALRELAPLLGDIHGQHEQQDLFSPQTQLEMLDQFCAGIAADAADSRSAGGSGSAAAPAGASDSGLVGGSGGLGDSGKMNLRDRVAAVFAQWSDAGRRLETLRRNEQEKLRLLDLWKFQRQEIVQAALKPGEDAALEEEKRVLANLARIQQAGASAYEALYESPGSAAAQAKAGARCLEDLARFDARFGELARSLTAARVAIEEAAIEIRKYLDRLEANPDRLGEIEDRLALVEKLKRKYGASIEQVLAFGEQVGAQLAELESSEDSIRRIEAEQRRLAAEYERLAAELSRRRRDGARRLQKPVETELGALAMERTRFEVAFDPVDPGSGSWTPRGTDRVHFLVSPNPGEPPRPLELVASGGELSRITLAIKTCLAGAVPAPRAGGGRSGEEHPRTLVFDEIDAGIGGRAAEAVGRRLHRLSHCYQLLCVTHLPQIAGFADHHYSVDKQVKAGRTVTTVTEIHGEARVQELARMLSGAEVTPAALRHAQQLLQSGRGPQRGPDVGNARGA